MKRFSIGVLAFGLMVLAVPVQASHTEQKSWSLGELLEFGGQALTEALQRGVEEIQDHIDIQANTRPGTEGETSTQLRLRLFPKGKDHPEAQMGADTELQYSLDPKRPHFNFDFKFLPRQSDDEYI